MALKNQKYIVHTSKGSVKIDEDEIRILLESLESGGVAIFRQGIVNPSFFVSLEPDKAKMSELQEELKYQIRDGGLDHYPPYEDMFKQLRVTTGQERVNNFEPFDVVGNNTLKLNGNKN